MSKSILRTGYIKIKLSNSEKKRLMEIKGDSDVGDFIGYLIREYRENYETVKVIIQKNIDEEMIIAIRDTMNRMIRDVEDRCILDKKATSVTQSVFQFKLKDNDYQVQIRVQGDRSAWIDPGSYELGFNNAIYVDMN